MKSLLVLVLIIVFISCEDPKSSEPIINESPPNISWSDIRPPQSGKIDFIGYDSNNNIYVFDDNERILAVSTDDGETWEALIEFLWNSVYDMLVTDKALLLCHESDTYVSTDNGENWVDIDKRFSTVFNYNNIIYGINNSSIYQSADGLNWNRIASFNKDFAVKSLINNIGELYILTGSYYSPRNGYHLWKSTNWTNWTEISFPIEHDYFLDIAAENNRILAQTESSLIYTDNDGQGWNTLYEGDISTFLVLKNEYLIGTKSGKLLTLDKNGIILYSETITNNLLTVISKNFNNSHLYIGTDYRGLFTKVETHIINSGYDVPYIYSVECGNNGNDIFVGTSNGVFRSRGNFEYWDLVLRGQSYIKRISDNIILIFQNSQEYYRYIIDEDSLEANLYQSTFKIDNKIFDQISLNKSSNSYNYYFNSYQSNSGKIYIHPFIYSSIYETDDKGRSWDKVNINEGSIISFVANDNDMLYFTKNQYHRIYRFDNIKKSQTELIINQSFSESSVLGINSKNHLFVGIVTAHPYNYHLYKSENESSWQNVKPNISYISNMYIDENDGIYYGDYYGLFYSGDDGNQWSRLLSHDEDVYNIRKINFSNEYSMFLMVTDRGYQLKKGIIQYN